MKAITIGSVSLLLSLTSVSWADEVKPPTIFAPGEISGPQHDSAPAFTPDGRTVYFTRSTPAQSTIVVSRRRESDWSAPQVAPFSGVWNDMEPTMAPDGSALVFVSNRPAQPGGAPIEGLFNGAHHPGGNLWRVPLSTSSAPVRLPDAVNSSPTTFAPSLAGDGSLYFMRTDEHTKKFRLYRAPLVNGLYGAPQPLSFSDGSATDVDPAVAADESFLVFGSGRAPAAAMDLFIVWKCRAGWGAPVHLGSVVNSPGSDAEARLGPDQRTLYFASERTIAVAWPRTAAQAVADQARAQAWDNGLYNIWSVSLAPWLAQPACSAK